MNQKYPLINGHITKILANSLVQKGNPAEISPKMFSDDGTLNLEIAGKIDEGKINFLRRICGGVLLGNISM